MSKKGLFIFLNILFLATSLSAQISEDTLLHRVKFLSENSADRAKVSDYIYDFLQNHGVLMLTDRQGDDFMMQSSSGDTISAKNIVGIIRGYDPAFNNEYILLGAHYDAVAPPGANHNASGVAALCEVAKLISENKFVFKRSVIVALFELGELGNAGSWYFVNRSFPEVDKIKYMLDFNSLGRGGENFPFQIFAGVPTKARRTMIESVNNRPFSLQAKILENPPFGSDYINFYEKEIPVALLTTGTSNLKGSANDTYDLLDYFQLKQIVEWAYSFSLVVATNPEGEFAGEEESDDTLQGEKIYSQFEVDRRASYMKSDERTFLRDWVYKYISYPQSAVDAGIDGVVETEFVVDAKGEVKNVRIVKSLSEALDAEVVKVINASPKWKPAAIGGKPVCVRIRIAVEFRLTKDGKIGFKW